MVWPSSKVFLDANDVLQRYGKWRPPSDAKAAARYRADHAHHDFFDVATTRVRDLKEFGIGHLQYFYILSFLAVLFGGLAAVVGLPMMLVDLQGRYYALSGLEVTSLGNFGRTAVASNYDGAKNITLATSEGYLREQHIAAVFMNDSALPHVVRPFNKAQASVAMSLLDMLGGLVYLFATLTLIWLCRRLSQEADSNTVTIHDYSIRVEGLPGDTAEGELGQFLGQYGEVVAVELVRAYGALLALVLERGRTIQLLQAATAQLQHEAGTWEEVDMALEHRVLGLKEQIEEMNVRIKELQGQGASARVVGAFVTFKREEGKASALRALPRSFMRKLLLRPEHKLRGAHALHVSDAPEPSDVKYENLECGAVNRFARAALTALLKYGALACGFGLISLASTFKYSTFSSGPSKSECRSACSYLDPVTGLLALSDASRAANASCHASTQAHQQEGAAQEAACSASAAQCYTCYCSEAMGAGMYNELSYCASQAYIMALQVGSQAAVVLVILIINTMLAWGSAALTAYEKHHTRSSEARSLAHKLFLSQFLNSALSTIVASAYLPWLLPLSNKLGKIFFRGIYMDLTPNWYKDVGKVLVTGQMLASGMKVAFMGMTWGMSAWRRRGRKSALTQQALDAAWTGPAFELAARYGQHLCVAYVAMLLGGGAPLIYASAAFYFTMTYWVEKWELLKLSRRPIAYGPDLAEMVVHQLPYAAVFHVCFSLWAFSLFGMGQSRMVRPWFATLIQGGAQVVGPAWQRVSGLGAQELARRLLQANAAHNLIMVMVVVGLLLCKVLGAAFLRGVRALLSAAGAIEDNEEAVLSGAPDFAVAVRMQLLVGSTSYAIQQQPAYQAAFMRVAGAEELSIGSTAHATAVVHVGGSGLERKGSRGAKAGARAEGGPRAGSQLWEGEGMEEPQQQLRRRHSQGGEPRAGAGHQAPVAAAAGQGAPVGQGRAAQQQQRVRRVRQGQVVPLEDDGS